MLKRSARVEDTSVISHKAYISLVHLLLSKVSDGEMFWNLIAFITRVLLIYKFSDCSDYFLESLNATKDVGALFVVSRVYFDHIATLVERHQVLENLDNNATGIQQVVQWGLMATISLNKSGKAKVEEIGSLEELCKDLNLESSEDTHLY